MKAVQKNLKWLDKHGKTLFWSLIGMTFLVASFYVYLVNIATSNGVRWGEADLEIGTKGAMVSELETHYFSLKQSVTLAKAYAVGFEDVKIVRFISTEKVGTVATANEI